MREDFFKVIVERPRKGGSCYRKSTKNIDIEELPTKESMKKKYGYNQKSLNENLAPLKRFLIGAANDKRLWNDVYSEICTNININSTVQRHVRQHVDWMVEQHTFMENGKVWSHGRLNYPIDLESGQVEFYVHPETGILIYKQYKKNWYKKKENKPLTKVVVNDKLQLHLINGNWFEIHFEKIPEFIENHKTAYPIMNSNWYNLFDAFLQDRVCYLRTNKHKKVHFSDASLWKAYGREDVYCVKKQQCCRKMIQRYIKGRKND